MMYCSYGNGYRLTGNDRYRQVIIHSAESLSSRFVPAAGIIRSWDFSRSYSGTPWYCPVIIDNMMNLELLFAASEITGNDKYRRIAVSHADSTLKYHIRNDYSCFHAVNYDTLTGTMSDRGTRQGLADNSAWARGQGWAIYGFTMTYRMTKDRKYLDAAQQLADFYINHPRLPEDGIPLWDFNAGDPHYASPWNYNPDEFSHILRDVSAAAVIASGLMELSAYSGEKSNRYFKAGEKILTALQTNYKNTGNRHHFILDHSVGDYPRHGEIDVPLVYADYYFLEALLRYELLSKRLDNIFNSGSLK
jgi:rhamnogalacturonyl hydrolase YesR